MSRWSKRPRQINNELIQNEQMRKKIVKQVAHKRKEQDNRLRQQAQTVKKEVQQAMEIIKRIKQQPNFKNLQNTLHDKYKDINQHDFSVQEDKNVGKWSKKNKCRKEKNLNMEVKKELHSKLSKNLENQPLLSNCAIQCKDQPEKNQQIQGSKLLNSLDLDINTVMRGKQYNKEMNTYKKPQKKKLQNRCFDQLGQIIDYDQLQVLKTHIISNKNINSNNNIYCQTKTKKFSKTDKKFQLTQKQGFTLNQLNKKLNIEKLEQVLSQSEEFTKQQDLRENKRILHQQLQQIKQTKQRSNSFKVEIHPVTVKLKSTKNLQHQIQNVNVEQVNEQQIQNRKIPIIRIRNGAKTNLKNRQPTNQKVENKQNQTHNHFPNIKRNENIQPKIYQKVEKCSHEQALQKNLINLNKQQKRLQRELRSLHRQNKDKIKQIITKHNIKTDYKHSQQLIIGNKDNLSEQIFKKHSANITEDQIEQSLQNLDNYLIQKNKQISKQINRQKQSDQSNIDSQNKHFNYQQQTASISSKNPNIRDLNSNIIQSRQYKTKTALYITQNIQFVQNAQQSNDDKQKSQVEGEHNESQIQCNKIQVNQILKNKFFCNEQKID